MKRKILAAAALLALLCACAPQQDQPAASPDAAGTEPPEMSAATDTTDAEPTPEIPETPWSLRVTRRSYDAAGKPDGWLVECYDDAGLLLSRTEHVGSDGTEFAKRYVYDENGLLMKTYEDGRLYGECGYDAEGNLVTETTYSKSGAVSTLREYVYDGAGRLVSERASGGDGEVYSSREYAYDEDGRLAFENNADGSCTAYVRDEAGNVTAKLGYSAAGELSTRAEYTCNADGRVLSEKYYAGGTLLWWYEFAYDESGNKVSFRCLNEKGELRDQVLFEYDEENRLLGSTHSDGEGNLVRCTEYEYEYADTQAAGEDNPPTA